MDLYKEKSNLVDEWPQLHQYMRVYDDTIRKVKEFTYLDEDENLLLFYLFKFKKDELENNYFNDTDGYRQKAGITSNMTQKISDDEELECLYCLCPVSVKNGGIHYGCGHLACKDCYQEYLLLKFQNQEPFPSCLQDGCNLKFRISLLKKYPENTQNELHTKYLIALGKKVVNKFQEKDQCCSNSSCSYVYRPQIPIHPDLVYDLCCPNQHEFCYKCGFEPHRPLPCKDVEKWQEKAGDGSMLDAFIKDNPHFFRCPKCSRVINYIQGCDQMTCGGRKDHNDLVSGQGCGHVFCWRCFEPWESHKSGWSGCNKFKPKAKTQQEQDNEKYMHYLQGFEDNRSMKMQNAKELLLQFDLNGDYQGDFNFKTEFEKHEISFTQYEIIIDALKFLIKARRTLKWTYVFGYYRISNEQRDLFEEQQGLFEMTLAQLQSQYTDHLKKLFLDYSSESYTVQTEFNKNIKQNINNSWSVAKQFCKNLLEHLEGLLIGENNYQIYKNSLKLAETNPLQNQESDNIYYDEDISDNDVDDDFDEDDDDYDYD